MKKEKYNVVVAGATGAVGNEMVATLEQRNFPVDKLKLLASTRGAGTKLGFKGKEYTVVVMNENSFAGMDIGLFSPGGSVSQKFAPGAGKAGCVVIDNTSAFRMDPEVPLIVPEVNSHAIAGYHKKNIIANPNCSTIQMVVPLKPIHDVGELAERPALRPAPARQECAANQGANRHRSGRVREQSLRGHNAGGPRGLKDSAHLAKKSLAAQVL